MGLKDAIDQSGQSVDDRAESKTSSSGGSSGYPKTEAKVPYLAIYTDDSGEMQFALQPDNLFIEYEKKSKSSSWSLELVPEEMERFFMSRQDWLLQVQRVDQELNIDLEELVRDDAEKALKAVRRAAKQHSPKSRPSLTETCPVCDKEIHVIKDDYSMVYRRRVCHQHTVKDLDNAGLLD